MWSGQPNIYNLVSLFSGAMGLDVVLSRPGDFAFLLVWKRTTPLVLRSDWTSAPAILIRA